MKLKALAVIIVLLTTSATAFSFSQNQGKGAIVKLSGTIQPSASGSIYSSGGLTPEKIRNLNEKVDKENYDAVIYEINSGGGAVVASKEILREIESVEVPTVCRFRDIAASGAYLFALGCDEVVADSSTITGSIGVKSSYIEFSEAMDKYGIDYVNISSGKYKNLGTPYKNATEEEKQILQEKAEKVHQQFLELVEERRNLSEDNLQEVRTGEIFLGDEAKEMNLVDSLGGREKAFEISENITGKELEFSEVETSSDIGLLSLLSAEAFKGFSAGFLEGVLGMSESPFTASY